MELEDLGRDPGGLVNEWGQAAVTRQDRSGLRSVAMDSFSYSLIGAMDQIAFHPPNSYVELLTPRLTLFRNRVCKE